MRQTTQIILVCAVALLSLSGWSQFTQQGSKIKNTCSMAEAEVKNLDMKSCMSDPSHFNFGFKGTRQIYDTCYQLTKDHCLH